MKKKKLFLLHDIPYPDVDGGKKLSLGRIMESAKEFEIIVIAFNYQGINDTEAIEFFNNKKISFFCYDPKPKKQGFSKIIKYLYSLFTKYPAYYTRLNDKSFTIYINNILKGINVNEVSIETIFLISQLEQFIKNVNSIEIVFHNVESLFFKELSKSSTKLYKKIVYLIESKKINNLEKIISKKINNENSIFPVCLSRKDSKIYQDNFKFDSSKIRINKNKIYLESTIEHTPNIKNPYFLFPGSIEFPPNKEAILWFLEEYVKIFKEPIKVLITGKYTESTKKEFCKYKFIEFSGFISNENLINYYKNCICVISPIISGGGIKIKNIETIALSIPLLMTEFSSIGIYCKNNKLIRISKNNPIDFTKKLMYFYGDIRRGTIC